jgi:hypothetical protein
VVEVGEADVGRLLRGRRPLWIEVNRDGVVALGRPLPADSRAATIGSLRGIALRQSG